MLRPAASLIVALLAVAACTVSATATDPSDPDSDGDGFAWPVSVGAFGRGYPLDRDPCRKLGETAVTANYLDHTRDLIGCPGGPDSPVVRALVAGGGRVVGQHDGVTMISVPSDSN